MYEYLQSLHNVYIVVFISTEHEEKYPLQNFTSHHDSHWCSLVYLLPDIMTVTVVCCRLSHTMTMTGVHTVMVNIFLFQYQIPSCCMYTCKVCLLWLVGTITQQW
jgi:hypothetical protein